MSAVPRGFKKIPGYENYYVTRAGEILSTFGGRNRILLTRRLDRAGYKFVRLTKKKHRSPWTIHHLVLLAFVGPRPEGMETRHLDGNKTNNDLKNLRYGTCKENYNDRRRHGTDNTGSRHGRAILREADIPAIKNLRDDGCSHRAIARRFGVSKSAITLVLNRRNWSHVSW